MPASFHISLVLGGARSGKSVFAERQVLATGLRALYVATCQAFDGEMQARIEAHKRQRQGQGWQTIEEPLDLPGCLEEHSQPGTAMLIDCLTLWLSNLLTASNQEPKREIERLKDFVRAHQSKNNKIHGDGIVAPIVFVSNEVGLGIVPENKLARQFRDLAGHLHQDLANLADSVTLVTAGLPLSLKGNS